METFEITYMNSETENVVAKGYTQADGYFHFWGEKDAQKFSVKAEIVKKITLCNPG